jgi:hypothetical protein
MKLHTALLAAFITIGVDACAVSAPPRRAAVVDIDVRPPPPRVVVVPAPRRGYVWAPGYWYWDGRRDRHVWMDGRWIGERRGWRWQPAHWEERRGRWHFEPGHWVRR